MAAIHAQGMEWDDASRTLTVDNLVVAKSMDTSEATPSGEVSQTKSTNYTMTAADSGKVTYVDTDAVVITLPATVVGMTFTISNSAADGAAKVSVSPNASDKIIGNGFTAADDKDAINTKATAKKGDFIRLAADGVDGWYVQAIRGIWAREA